LLPGRRAGAVAGYQPADDGMPLVILHLAQALADLAEVVGQQRLASQGLSFYGCQVNRGHAVTNLLLSAAIFARDPRKLKACAAAERQPTLTLSQPFTSSVGRE
jgi:hypothetical protein